MILEQIILEALLLRKSSYDNFINLLSSNEKFPSSTVDVLIVENRNVEMESVSLYGTTFTKSFPDDMNEKEKV